MSNTEFEAYLFVDELCEQEGISARVKLENMVMTGFGLKTK